MPKNNTYFVDADWKSLATEHHRENLRIRRRIRRAMKWLAVKKRVKGFFCRHEYEWRRFGKENEIKACRKCGRVTAMRHMINQREDV